MVFVALVIRTHGLHVMKTLKHLEVRAHGLQVMKNLKGLEIRAQGLHVMKMLKGLEILHCAVLESSRASLVGAKILEVLATFKSSMAAFVLHLSYSIIINLSLVGGFQGKSLCACFICGIFVVYVIFMIISLVFFFTPQSGMRAKETWPIEGGEGESVYMCENVR